MKIALDYDGTYTLDPKMWLMFINTCFQRNHDVRILTMRYPHEIATMDRELLETKIDVIFTSRRAKKSFAIDKGFNADIWIDDMPEFLFTDAGG